MSFPRLNGSELIAEYWRESDSKMESKNQPPGSGNPQHLTMAPRPPARLVEAGNLCGQQLIPRARAIRWGGAAMPQTVTGIIAQPVRAYVK